MRTKSTITSEWIDTDDDNDYDIDCNTPGIGDSPRSYPNTITSPSAAPRRMPSFESTKNNKTSRTPKINPSLGDSPMNIPRVMPNEIKALPGGKLQVTN